MYLKKIALLLLSLMLLGGCGTSSQMPSGSVAASSQINVPEKLTQMDGRIITRSEIYREHEHGPALMDLTLESADGEEGLFLDAPFWSARSVWRIWRKV